MVVDAPADTEIYQPETVQHLARVIASKCDDANYKPDVVIGLAPWLDPAHAVATELGVEQVASIQIVRRNPPDGPLSILSAPRFLTSMPRLGLLVAPGFREGVFMQYAQNYLQDMMLVLHVRTAALVATGQTGLLNSWLYPNLDFFGEMRPTIPDFYWSRATRNERRY